MSNSFIVQKSKNKHGISVSSRILTYLMQRKLVKQAYKVHSLINDYLQILDHTSKVLHMTLAQIKIAINIK